MAARQLMRRIFFLPFLLAGIGCAPRANVSPDNGYAKPLKNLAKPVPMRPELAAIGDAEARSRLDKGVRWAELGRADLAIKDFTSALEIRHGFVEANYNRGLAYAVLGRWKEAVADFDRVIESDPRHSFAYSNRGAAYSEMNETALALQDQNRALELNAGNQFAYWNRSVLRMKSGDIDGAIEDAENGVRYSSNVAIAYTILGDAYLEADRYKEARAAFGKAIELDPKYPGSYCGLAVAALRSGDTGRAVNLYRKAIELEPLFAQGQKRVESEAMVSFATGSGTAKAKYWFSAKSSAAIEEILKLISARKIP